MSNGFRQTDVTYFFGDLARGFKFNFSCFTYKFSAFGRSPLEPSTFNLKMKTKITKDHLLHFKEFLRSQFQLTETHSETIQEYFKLQPFSKNEYFVRQGKVCRQMAFIAEGVMRYCMFRDDGSDVTCFLMWENDFVGDSESFFSQKPSDKNVQALTDCQLMTISFENMQKLLVQIPNGKEINEAIGRYVMTKMLYQRTFLLNLDATVRYKEFMREYADILQRIPLSYVANFLGIAQQSLSRLRKQMPGTFKNNTEKN